MEKKNEIFRYCGNPVSFETGDSVMVNATQMAESFCKRTSDFLSSKSTKKLIGSLSAKTGIPATGLVVVNQGGTNQGTWMHEDLALVFAQWLSPDFYLWCNDRVKEILLASVMAPPAKTINGVTPVMVGGVAWYCYADLMCSVGRTSHSTAVRRRCAPSVRILTN